MRSSIPSSVTSSDQSTSAACTGTTPSSSLVHTLKNNLQVLLSLSSLHGRNITDRKALSAFARVRGALLLYAEAYNFLLHPTHDNCIHLGDFLQKAITQLAATYSIGSGARRSSSSIPNIPVPFSTAVSWALLINEVLGDLASSVPDHYPAGELSTVGTIEDAHFFIALSLPRISSASSVDHQDEPQHPGELSGVGTALMLQCEATVTWSPCPPLAVSIHFPLPAS